jgi:hypothetical protein
MKPTRSRPPSCDARAAAAVANAALCLVWFVSPTVCRLPSPSSEPRRQPLRTPANQRKPLQPPHHTTARQSTSLANTHPTLSYSPSTAGGSGLRSACS